jgi:hypothetical protein
MRFWGEWKSVRFAQLVHLKSEALLNQKSRPRAPQILTLRLSARNPMISSGGESDIHLKAAAPASATA